MSDLQYAYLLGEVGDYQLGGPALFYEEYSCQHLDLRQFSGAVYELMQRHEMLRATFDEAGLLHVHDELPVPLNYRLLRGQPDQVCRTILAESRERLYAKGPSLNGKAPFEISVFALDDSFVVQVCGRLMAMDGFSGEIFAQELRLLLDGQPLPPLRYSYRQYRQDVERRKENEEYVRARKYWLDRLDTLPAAPELPRRRLTGDPDSRLVRRTFNLSPAHWSTLAARIRKNRLTPTMVIGAAFAEVLRHWAKDPSFTINIMYGERAPFHPDVDKVIGNFSSTVLVECSPGTADGTFTDRARLWRRQLLQDLEHSAFSGVSVIRELNQRQGNSRSALMPVVFTSMLGVGDADSGVFLEHLGWQRLAGRVRTPQVALDHQVFLADNALVITWDSTDDLYPAGMIDDMFAAYRALLTRLATDDTAWQCEAFDLTPAAQLAIRTRVNDTTAPAPSITLHELFQQQAERHPDRIAVVAGGRELTYGRLMDQASAVSAELQANGVKPGQLVGVLAPRGSQQIAGLLGVLMSGAAYVPISPDWPKQRRDRVAAIAGLDVILADRDVAAEATEGARTVDITNAIARQDGSARPEISVPAEALAYVIFTSGTTGTPKGVMITHGSVANTIVDINERFGINPRDRVLAVSDYTFDLSVWDVFGMLAAGGTVVVPDPALSREVTHLHDLCRQHGVTVWNSVPAYLGMFIDFIRSGQRPRLTDLRLAMVSGDWVPVNMAAELGEVAPNAACVSLGGATEASIWSNYFPVPTDVPTDWVSIPYGYPLRNQRFQVLDSRLRDRPDWVPGELFIAGRGLAEGYLGNPELTAAAFLRHPRYDERIYRTGDWAKYWPDGTLEFLGRQDPQVKINGFRVELGEIEAVLLTHPAVTDAAVVTRTEDRGSSLVAFVSSQTPAELLVGQLRSHVADALPAYMVPPVIDVQPGLPLTANGKVDRRQLMNRARSFSAAMPKAADAARTPTERRLAELWQDLLRVAQVGRHDDFFGSGGSSLQAAQLMNRIEQEFGQRLPLATLYTSGSLAQLAQRLDTAAQVSPATCLVTLADNDLPLLVLVHPVGGDLLCYRRLVACLESRFRIVGLRSTDSPAGTTIEDMANRYLAELTPVLGDHTGGPVRLAGWSLGGAVAYEMTRRLRATGRSCSVALIDPWLRCAGGPAPDGVTLVRAFLHNLAGAELDQEKLGLSRGQDPEQALRRVWSSPPEQLSMLASLSFAELTSMYQVFETNTRALLRYAATPEPGLSVDVIEAVRGLGGPAATYLAPLRDAAPALTDVHVRRMDSTHFDLLDAEHAAQLAELVGADPI